jgi:hypothetical protein
MGGEEGRKEGRGRVQYRGMRIGNKGRQRRTPGGMRLGDKGRQRRRGWLHITDRNFLVSWQ